MLFVSRFSNLTVNIRGALLRRGENELGQTIQEVIRPDLAVNFVARAMTEPQRIIAVRMFTELNPAAPWGSVPYEVGGVMGQEFGDIIMDTESYSGYNPAFNLSKYDTRTDVPYEAQLAHTPEERTELKVLIEDALLGSAWFNRDYIRLDESLPKPWPAYSSEGGPGWAKKLVAQARDFGIPMRDIVEYEKTQDKPNQQIIAEVELMIAKDVAEAAEREALGAVIE